MKKLLTVGPCRAEITISAQSHWSLMPGYHKDDIGENLPEDIIGSRLFSIQANMGSIPLCTVSNVRAPDLMRVVSWVEQEVTTYLEQSAMPSSIDDERITVENKLKDKGYV